MPADGSAQLHDATNALHDDRRCGARGRATSSARRRRQRRRQPRRLPVPDLEDGRHRRRPDARVADLVRRRARLGDLRPDRAGRCGSGTRSGRPAGRTAWCRWGSATYAVTRGSRRATAPTAPSSSSTSTSSRRAWPGRRVKDADFVGKAAYLRAARRRPPAGDPVHADASTTRRRRAGVKRYMLGREPILTPDGEPLVDAKGRRSYVTSAGSGPSVGKHLLMSYLPPAQAVEGTELARRVLRRALPGHRGGGRRDPAVRPRERPDPVLSRAMNILVCVKRVPATGGRIVLTADGQDDRHAVPRVHDQPARGVRRRGGGPDRRGAGRPSTVLTLGPAEAEEQLRDAMAIGIDRAILLETDGARLGSGRDRRPRSSRRSGRRRRPTARST